MTLIVSLHRAKFRELIAAGIHVWECRKIKSPVHLNRIIVECTGQKNNKFVNFHLRLIEGVQSPEKVLGIECWEIADYKLLFF